MDRQIERAPFRDLIGLDNDIGGYQAAKGHCDRNEEKECKNPGLFRVESLGAARSTIARIVTAVTSVMAVAASRARAAKGADAFLFRLFDLVDRLNGPDIHTTYFLSATI